MNTAWFPVASYTSAFIYFLEILAHFVALHADKILAKVTAPYYVATAGALPSAICYHVSGTTITFWSFKSMWNGCARTAFLTALAVVTSTWSMISLTMSLATRFSLLWHHPSHRPWLGVCCRCGCCALRYKRGLQGAVRLEQVTFAVTGDGRAVTVHRQKCQLS